MPAGYEQKCGCTFQSAQTNEHSEQMILAYKKNDGGEKQKTMVTLEPVQKPL